MELKNPTSAILPSHFLRTAHLVARVPFRASRLDPRISYGLYIPPEQYVAYQSALHSKQETSHLRLPLIVNVHGTKHDPSPHREALVDFADTHGFAILAPFYPAALDDSMDLDSYKLLRSPTLSADLVLLSILDEIKHIWPGIRTERFTLAGFSGGGQFAHRFMYLYPERLSAVVVGAPGRVTKLSDEPWPQGVGNLAEVFHKDGVDVDAIQKIGRILLVVGEKDNDNTKVLELKKWLVKQKSANQSDESHETEQREANDWKIGRLDVLKSLRMHWQEQGIDTDFEIVPDAGHNHLLAMPAIQRWFEKNLDILRA